MQNIGSFICFIAIFHEAIALISPKPNFVVIVSDDMGFNDVGFHGSNQIPTPNIDALAAYGINLNRYYVEPMCTPSRSSLMTGKYSSSLGMQHYVIANDQPYGLGLNEKLLSEYLREAGYNTHIVGKWHLGFYKKEYTPTFRGFDSHIGYLGSYVDYYNHSLSRIGTPWNYESGYDMRKNLEFYRESVGVYATDLFTNESIKIIKNHNKANPLFLYIPHSAPHAGNYYDPLQAPQDVVEKFLYIKDENRRKYAAMVSILDDSVGRVVNALKENHMLDNTVILFFGDNGAPIEGEHSNAGSNNPFRGQKFSPWEGAIHTTSAIWSPLLQNRERTSNQLFHVSDWLPTFAALAGVAIDKPIDGKDIWSALSLNLNSPREDVLCQLDDVVGVQSYIRGNYKYINGTTSNGIYDHWMDYIDKTEMHSSFQKYGESIKNSLVGQAIDQYSVSKLDPLTIENHRQSAIITCNNVPVQTEKPFQCAPLEGPCVFNIIDDPCERRNIALLRPATLQMLENEVNIYRLKAKPTRNQPLDERSNPAYFNLTWTWWFDEYGIPDHGENIASNNRSFMTVSVTAIFIIICIPIVLHFLYNFDIRT